MAQMQVAMKMMGNPSVKQSLDDLLVEMKEAGFSVQDLASAANVSTTNSKDETGGAGFDFFKSFLGGGATGLPPPSKP